MRNKKKIIIISTVVATVLIITAIAVLVILSKDSGTEENNPRSESENIDDRKEKDPEEEIFEDDMELPGKVAAFIEINSEDDLAALNGYDSVEELRIVNADLSDFRFLSEINVRSLVIRDNNTPFDLEFVNERYLESLSILACDVKDRSLISNFKNLKNFEYMLYDIAPDVELGFLSDCSKLQKIKLQNLIFTDCSFVENMDQLETFSAYRCGVDDLTPFKNCHSLKELSLIISGVSDLSPLKDLKLRTLKIEESMVEDVSPLEKMSEKSLSTLSLKDNYISDVSPIKKGKKLSEADLSCNFISEFPSHLASINMLDLSYNNISNISEQDIAKIKKFSPVLNLFDNLLDESVMGTLASIDTVRFTTVAGNIISVTEAIEYNKKMKEALKFCDKGEDDEKVFRAVYYVCQNTLLDISLVDPYKDDAYGVFFTRAVCGGTTDLTNSICKHMGIKASRYHGDIDDADDDMMHVWSVVNIDGRYYHCDAMQSMGFYDSYNMPLIALISDDDIKTYGHLLIAKNIPKSRNSLSNERREEIIQFILSE